MSLQKQISLHADKLTYGEQRLLRELLEKRDEFEYKMFTIAFIADYFNVSTTGAHRLSQKLGYESFIHFKDDYFLRHSDAKDLSATQNDYIDRLIHTYYSVDESDTAEIIEKMISAKRITIYGMGMSNFLGKIFQIKLLLLGKTAEQYDDSRFMRLSAKNLTKDEDLVFILSRSGKPPELIEAVVEANLRNIDIVLITEATSSPLNNLATYVIQTAHSKDLDSDIDTRLNAHIAMDILINKFVETKKIKDRDQLNESV